MAVVALFVVFSVAAGVFMAARNTFAPADSTSGNQPSASEQTDFQQEDSVPLDNTETDNSSEYESELCVFERGRHGRSDGF